MLKLLYSIKSYILSALFSVIIVGGAVLPMPCKAATTTDEPQFVVIGLCVDLSVMIRLEEISSVSIHKYRLNGAIGMTEVTVDVKGQNSIRFFASDSGSKSGVYVSKHYPEASHSHTVEYRVSSVGDLRKIMADVSDAMESGKGVKIQVSPGAY